MRRYAVRFREGKKVRLVDPVEERALLEIDYDALLNDGRAVRVNLTAAGRCVLVYLLAQPGVYVTGGGSRYNEYMSREYASRGFREPNMIHISGRKFREVMARPMGTLKGRAGNIRYLMESEIESADDDAFGRLLGD